MKHESDFHLPDLKEQLRDKGPKKEPWQVLDGIWSSELHLAKWQLYKHLPKEYRHLYHEARGVLNPQVKIQPTSFYITPESELAIIVRIVSGAPMDIHFFNPSQLKTQGMFREDLQMQLERVEDPKYRQANHFVTHKKRGFHQLTIQPAIPDVAAEILDNPPMLMSVTVSPFRLFEKDKPTRIVGEDPWRFRLGLGFRTPNAHQ